MEAAATTRTMTTKRDLRERIANVLDEMTDAEVRELVRDSLKAEKVVYVDITCKNDDCGKTYRYPVRVPNWMERAKVLDILATQSKGKPAEAPKALAGETAAKNVEGMTFAELEAEEQRLLSQYPELADGEPAPPAKKRRRAPARRSPS